MRPLCLLTALAVALAAQTATLNLTVVEGEGATNNIRQRTARDPIVQVEDENHKPIAGAIVVFTLPSRGAGGAFANGSKVLTATTNEKGQAVARGLQPNGVKGQFQIHVNASFQGKTASLNISQTNAAIAASGAAAGGISGKLIAVLAVAGAAAAGGAYYATHHGSGSSSAPTATTISAGVGVAGPPR